MSAKCNALARRRMKMLTLVHCRGLIYQALSQAIHPLGLMNQTPTIESSHYLFFFVVLRVLRGYFHARRKISIIYY
jgi:hypothetical protein